jgi:uncharacterized membrane protein YGL010W
MRKIDELLTAYGDSHQNTTNKNIHWVCVPVIFISILGLLASAPADFVQRFLGEGNPYANWAFVAVVLVIIYYVSLSVALSLGMAVFALVCLFIVRVIDHVDFMPLWLVSLVIFIVAWAGQFYGHKVEGRKPSFLKDLQFLLIGPAWLMHFIYKKIGIPY